MRSRISIYTAIILAFILFGSSVQSKRACISAAPIPTGPEEIRVPVIRSSTHLVMVPVSVRNASGQPVTDLRMEDFSIRENDQAVSLQYLEKPELTRLEIVLVFDITSSTWFYFDFVQEAATGFVKSIFQPGNAVSIVGISSPPEILLQRTESLPDILDGLARLRRGAATAFFDAIAAATRLFPNRITAATRRVVVVLSDGEDNLSMRNLDDALEQVQKADCVFFSINPGTSAESLNRVSRRGQQWMETLADQTGGIAFLAESYKDLSDIYSRIADELQVQYLLSYTSPDSEEDGSFRSISVTVPGRPELNVRARKGYYAD